MQRPGGKECDSAQSYGFFKQNMERAMGIEPTALAWEARVLPLYDARVGGNFYNQTFIGTGRPP